MKSVAGCRHIYTSPVAAIHRLSCRHKKESSCTNLSQLQLYTESDCRKQYNQLQACVKVQLQPSKESVAAIYRVNVGTYTVKLQESMKVSCRLQAHIYTNPIVGIHRVS